MALIQRTSPVALDKDIARFQSYMYTKLGFADWDSRDRANGVTYKNGIIPEHFIVDGEYSGDLFHNDDVVVNSFFYASPIRTTEGAYTVVDVAWIFSLNLKELFPTITHYSDEEFSNKVLFEAMRYSGYDMFKFDGMVAEVDNVYREFIRENITFTDMSEKHVRRFNFRVKYSPDCT